MNRPKSIRISLPTLQAFERIYAQIPSIDCKGLCHDSCGMVPMTEFEWNRMVARHGATPGIRLVDETDGKPWCPFLKTDRKCEHYQERPLICRLWGVVDVEGMRCVHGCKPTEYLTDADAKELMAAADRLGGGPVPDQMEIIVAGMKSGKFSDPFEAIL